MRQKKRTQPHSREYSEGRKETVSDLFSMMDSLGIGRDFIHSSFGFEPESFSLLESDLPIYLWVHDENRKIVYGNSWFLDKYGNCNTKSCHKKIMGREDVCSCCLSGEALECNKSQSCKFCKRCKSGLDINIFHWPMTSRQGDRFVMKSSFYVEDSSGLLKDFFNKELDERAYPRLLISCSACKKIKDRDNNWVRVDKYILDHCRGRTSHGICPECIKLLYPGLDISSGDTNPETEP